MLRRQIRERKEYLYRKAQEEKQRATEVRKQKVRSALETNAPLPTDLKKDALSIQKLLDTDTPGIDPLETHEDDEYRWAGVEDPNVYITTGHDASSKLKEFAKELRLVFPNSQRVNRGKTGVKELANICRANNVTDLVIIHEHRGIPNAMEICHMPYGPTAFFSLSNVVMRHDIPDVGPMSEVFPHLVFHNFSSKLGNRVKSILKYLFPVPKEESQRVVTFFNDDDFISFRQHTWSKGENKADDPVLTEIGPRFEMQIYKIVLGTIEHENIADVEWRLHNFVRTANKRKLLTNPEDEDQNDKQT
ncbi:U3 small nucleolar ribonucleoprotein IMP4-like [Convolutriloba macropyga]|uniref:U3 small nucleolar ribonucleoprotein IMP4-like n=1 Tax=Convolutriloba macropyga TaxID=536237 RepID=UPI003F51C3C4